MKTGNVKGIFCYAKNAAVKTGKQGISVSGSEYIQFIS